MHIVGVFFPIGYSCTEHMCRGNEADPINMVAIKRGADSQRAAQQELGNDQTSGLL